VKYNKIDIGGTEKRSLSKGSPSEDFNPTNERERNINKFIWISDKNMWNNIAR